MSIKRNKLYSIMFIACLAGYTWLYYSISNNKTVIQTFEICLIKHSTGIPCPACGSTRSIISLIEGNLYEAIELNPLGVIVASIMLVAPIWIIFDVLARRKTFLVCYNKIETSLKRPRNAIPLILLVIMNWIWNITKGL